MGNILPSVEFAAERARRYYGDDKTPLDCLTESLRYSRDAEAFGQFLILIGFVEGWVALSEKDGGFGKGVGKGKFEDRVRSWKCMKQRGAIAEWLRRGCKVDAAGVVSARAEEYEELRRAKS